MKKEKLSAFVLAALFLLCVIASQAVAQQFSLIKVVDTNTPIPGGSGNFTVFIYGEPYMVSGSNVALQAGGLGNMVFTYSTEPP